MTAISATSGPDGDLKMVKTLCAWIIVISSASLLNLRHWRPPEEIVLVTVMVY
jgi:hypothetical protein